MPQKTDKNMEEGSVNENDRGLDDKSDRSERVDGLDIEPLNVEKLKKHKNTANENPGQN